MGARVAFGTRQSNFAVINQKFNYSGFSGFPFAFFTKEEAEEYYGATDFLGESGSPYPFEFTLDELVEFWWRIKKIDFGSITFPGDGDLVPAFTVSGTIDSYEGEIQLVTELSKEFDKRFDDAFIYEGGPVDVILDIVNEDINCIFHNEKYYPFFSFFMAAVQDDGQLLSTVSGFFSDLETPIGTLKYKEKSTTLYSYFESATVLNIDLTPSEYYAYAATDGSPIYNTSTGERLQDPRN